MLAFWPNSAGCRSRRSKWVGQDDRVAPAFGLLRPTLRRRRRPHPNGGTRYGGPSGGYRDPIVPELCYVPITERVGSEIPKDKETHILAATPLTASPSEPRLLILGSQAHELNA
jgi:hypothetical protein